MQTNEKEAKQMRREEERRKINGLEATTRTGWIQVDKVEANWCILYRLSWN